MERWWERRLSLACQSAGKDKNKQTSNPVSCTSPPGCRGKGWDGGGVNTRQRRSVLGGFEKTLLWFRYGDDQRAFLINYHLTNRSRPRPISMSRGFVHRRCRQFLLFIINRVRCFFNGQNVSVINDDTQICPELFHMCILEKSFEETF